MSLASHHESSLIDAEAPLAVDRDESARGKNAGNLPAIVVTDVLRLEGEGSIAIDAIDAPLASQFGNFPSGNIADRTLLTGRETYAAAIKKLSARSARSPIEIGSIFDDADRQLNSQENLKLAADVGYSPPTVSKFRKIHASRDRLLPHIDRLPGLWTVQYELVCLTERHFLALVQSSLLRPDLTAEAIRQFVLLLKEGSAASGASSIEPAETSKFRPFAVVNISKNADDAAEKNLMEELQLLSKRHSAELKPVASKRRDNADRCKALIPDLEDKLTRDLSQFFGEQSGLSAEKSELLHNAAWQHHSFEQNRAARYHSSDPRSIEHADHPYSINGEFKDAKSFRKHLRELKIITVLSPIGAYAELGETKCIKLALDYCQAQTAKAKSVAKSSLEFLVKTDERNVDCARKYLDLILDRGHA